MTYFEHERRRIRLPAVAYDGGGMWLVTISTIDRSARVFAHAGLADDVAQTIHERYSHLEVSLDAFCLMPDHAHLLFQTTTHHLVAVVADLKATTTRTWWRHGCGLLWQRSFHDRGIRSARDHDLALRYVLDNPVRAGLVEAWDDYPFSGGRNVLRGKDAPASS